MMIFCRNAMEMHWLLLYGWPTLPSCFTSSVVTWKSPVCVPKLRTYSPSACSMHSCCSSTLCRMDFTRRCRRSSAQILMLTVVLVTVFVGVTVVYLPRCSSGNKVKEAYSSLCCKHRTTTGSYGERCYHSTKPRDHC